MRAPMWAAAAAAALVLAACTSGGEPPRPPSSDQVSPSASSPGAAPTGSPASGHCGLERWSVKTGTDPGAAKVDLTHTTPATVVSLDSLAAPASPPATARVAPTETTVYVVHATLTEFKLEADSDYHLVLTDGSSTMIAEIPDPHCVGLSSPFLPGIEQARAQFDARFFHPSGQFFTHVSVPVTVTGVGFFDFDHGQSGVAPNAIELHPVLSVIFGS